MKNILVVADLKGGKNLALKRALSLQKHSKAKITLLGFCYVDIKNPNDLKTAKLSRKELEKFVLEQRNKELKDVLKQHNASNKLINAKAVWSKDISKAICKHCENHPVDLVLKSGNRSESWLYASTDWQLFRYCKAPVMITAGKSWKKKPRILAAVDLETRNKTKLALNHKIITQAQALAQELDEELHLVWALKVPEALADLDLINPRKYVADKRKKVQPLVDELCQTYKIDPDRVHISKGDAGKVVPSIANKIKADLLISGTMGRKGVKAKLMGNTAEDIIRKLYTDILVVKP